MFSEKLMKYQRIAIAICQYSPLAICQKRPWLEYLHIELHDTSDAGIHLVGRYNRIHAVPNQIVDDGAAVTVGCHIPEREQLLCRVRNFAHVVIYIGYRKYRFCSWINIGYRLLNIVVERRDSSHDIDGLERSNPSESRRKDCRLRCI